MPVRPNTALEAPSAALPADLSVRVLKRGPWGKADILRIRHRDGELILKDYSSKGWVVRWFGRRQLWRERRALRRLQGVAGIPVVLGEAAPCGLLLEPMEGTPITRWRRRPPEEIAAMLERLERLVRQIHERGVAHLDLRKRDNILVSDAGQPSVIDFNASVAFDPGSIGARLLFPFLRGVDRAALLKWRHLLLPDRLTPRQRRRHRRQSRLRRLWIFN